MRIVSGLKIIIPLTGAFLLLLFYGCRARPVEELAEEFQDFPQILEEGRLTMITLNSSHSYFIYKDEPMGYDYELCKNFCDHYGLELTVKVAENATRLLQMLEEGEGDLVAYPVVIQNELKDSVIFCGPEQISHQVLVQRQNKGDTLVTDVTGLIGKEIHVKQNTKYHQRLKNLDAELGNGLNIQDIEKDTVTVEDLIEMVAKGKIKYTVSDEYIARLNRTYYNNIHISLPLSFEQRSRWVVRKNSPELAKALDNWVEANDYKRTYESITKRYFELSKYPFYGEAHTRFPRGRISIFDELFKKYAHGTSFEWQLIAAIAYQESGFATDLTSWAGATGLMGLMPRTAEGLGIRAEDRTDPELCIMAGVKYLKQLERIFSKITDPEERLKFVLAAYNGGNGHIFDAQALAQKYGDNPHIWDNVEKYVLLKSQPEYYNDPVVRNGYFRGTETANYVRQVINNWYKYKGIH